MSKKDSYQVGKTKKGKGKNIKTEGFDLNSNLPFNTKTLKPNSNKETKEGKKRLSFVLIYFLVFITSILFGVLYYFIVFVYKIFSSLF